MPETIEERTHDLYTAVGYALSRWSAVEWELCNLFVRCMTAMISDAPVSQAFWAVLAFEAKLKMAHAVISRRCKDKPDYLSQWTTIHNRLTAQSKKRNKIAHGTVMQWEWEASGVTKIDVFLAPYFYSMRSMPMPKPGEFDTFDSRPTDRMYVPDIMRNAKGFCVTRERIDRLVQQFFQTEILPKLPRSKAGSGQ
jgi:hypothetical protein